MGEVLVQRDETNRIVGFVARGLSPETLPGIGVFQLLRAGSAALTDYLHVPTESSLSEEMYLAVDRSDPHLARELDAVLETLATGFRLLERDCPDDLVVHDAAVGVEVV